MKYVKVLLFLSLLTIISINAEIYQDCSIYGNCQPSITSTTSINSSSGSNSTFNETYNNLLNQDCPIGYVVNGTYANGTFKCISVLSTTYYPNNSAVTGGSYTDTNNLTDAYYYDGRSLNFTEGSGANPLDVIFNFTNVNSFSQLAVREYYIGSASHFIQVQIWNYDTSSWEDYFEFVGQSGFTLFTIPVYDDNEHISNGNVSVRFHHVQTGISSHRLYFDFIWLIEGNSIGSSTNLDGYARYLFGTNFFSGTGNFTTTGIGTFGDLIVDTNAFFVNGSNNYVGVGTAYPKTTLHLGQLPPTIGGRSYSLLIQPTTINTAARFAFSGTDVTGQQPKSVLMGESGNAQGDFSIYTSNDSNFTVGGGTANWTLRFQVLNRGGVIVNTSLNISENLTVRGNYICNSTNCYSFSEILNDTINDLTGYAKYQFDDNNFNGSGNFNTTGDIQSEYLYFNGSKSTASSTWQSNGAMTLGLYRANTNANLYPFFLMAKVNNTMEDPKPVGANTFSGGINLYVYNGSAYIATGSFGSKAATATAGGYYGGEIAFNVNNGSTVGANVEAFMCDYQECVFNDAGLNRQFRVETDDYPNALYINASIGKFFVNMPTNFTDGVNMTQLQALNGNFDNSLNSSRGRINYLQARYQLLVGESVGVAYPGSIAIFSGSGTANSTLTSSSWSSDLTVSGALTSSGLMTCSNNLAVTNNATISKNLFVTGNSTMTGFVKTTGVLWTTSNLQVDGNYYVNSSTLGLTKTFVMRNSTNHNCTMEFAKGILFRTNC